MDTGFEHRAAKPPEQYTSLIRYFALHLAAALCMVPLFFGCSRTVPIPASISTSGIPQLPETLASCMNRYQEAPFATFVGWHPEEEGIIILRRAGEISQLFTIAKPHGKPHQLTSFTEPVIACEPSPNAGRPLCLFTHDRGGDENFQISGVHPSSGKIIPFTRDSSQNSGMLFSHRGDRFAWSSNRRNGVDADIYIASVDTFNIAAPVCSSGGAWSVSDWSPNDSSLLLQHYISRTSSILYILSLQTGICQPLCDSSDTVSQEIASWGRSGIFYTSDKNTDFRCLHFIDTRSWHDTLITPAIPWDVREIALSHDATLLAFATNENGFSQLYLMNTTTFSYQQVTTLPRSIIGHLKFSPNDQSLGMKVTTITSPDDVYELDCSKLALRKWTDNTPSYIDTTRSPSVSVVAYPTFDTIADAPRQIPCLIYRPADKKPPWPVLIQLHGGPESQFWPSFKPDLLFYLNEFGIAVVAPNVRGSGGYGKQYLDLDNGTLRENAVKDIGALLDWIAAEPEFDTSRILVSGGSYGGYLTLAAMVAYSSKLKAGIDTYGIANFITYFEKTAPYRRNLRRVEYGDERIPEMHTFLEQISPIRQAGKITKPLLIVQGANDARVPLYESEQMASALREQGNDVWLLIANDEGHGFRKKSNGRFQTLVNAAFIKKHLLE